ncbi:hypothetical protein BJV82DRAFT_631914 [Fennellomyces sp. T-0311]|nr:hypothetical protein BJV82DRAFT_631914 [Fennellomyces sp. T-0311]
MRRTPFAWAALAFITTVFCQDPDFDTSVNHYNTTFRLANDQANGFSVEYHNWYKVVTNHQVNQQYALVCCGQPTTGLSGYHAVLNTPVTNVGVTNVRDVLPYMELLGLSDRVKSIEGYQNVTSPCYGGVTDSPGNSTVDVIFSDQTQASIPGSTYIAFSPDNEQLTPLQQATWLVYIGLFFDKEGEATTAFNNIESSYSCHKDNLADLPDKKNVAVTRYESTNRTWTLVNTPYYKSLVQDAGGKLVEPNSAQSPTYAHINEFHTAIRYADFAIDITPLADLGNQSYDSWLNLGGFNGNFDVYSEPFIVNKNVFRTDGLVNDNGYSGNVADIILRDRIWHFEVIIIIKTLGISVKKSNRHGYVILRNRIRQTEFRQTVMLVMPSILPASYSVKPINSV